MKCEVMGRILEGGRGPSAVTHQVQGTSDTRSEKHQSDRVDGGVGVKEELQSEVFVSTPGK